MHSTTKYLNGHSDVIGGALVMNDKELYDKLQFLQNAVGAVPGPFDRFPDSVALKLCPLEWKGTNKMR